MGRLDTNAFNGWYSFLDEIHKREIETWKHCVGTWKTWGKKGQKEQKRLIITVGGLLQADQEELMHLLQEHTKHKQANVFRATRRMVKERLKKDVVTGKHGAYYLKHSKLGRMEAEAKFDKINK